MLSAVGLLPAHLVGIDLEELLAGARFMDQRLQETQYLLAHRLAALYYLFAARKQRPILVFMPYSAALSGLAEWFCQLWAESLGKKFDLSGRVVHAGSTPVKAVGSTDQHSQLQLYMEGPQDKLITFLEVEKFKHHLEIPNLFPDQEELSYLGEHSLGELLATERRATAFNLMKAGRPSLSLRLPEINPFTVGQLIYLLEVVTVAAGQFFGVNPLDQPGVEGGKQTTYGLMGRRGFEAQQQEFAAGPARLWRSTRFPERYETPEPENCLVAPGQRPEPLRTGKILFFARFYRHPDLHRHPGRLPHGPGPADGPEEKRRLPHLTGVQPEPSDLSAVRAAHRL